MVKKTREEKLAQARLNERQKYEELKKDPENHAREIEKERLRYLKRKQENKDMTHRQQVSTEDGNSPKVKILSDVPLHWTNTAFCVNARPTPNKSYQTDFERFIATPFEKDESESNKYEKSEKGSNDNYKENKEFFDSDSDLDIF